MADDPQLHDLTKLLLARLETYPEEFSKGNTHSYKWYKAVEAVREHGAKVDKETLNAALHKFYMDEALRGAMQTLLDSQEPAKKTSGAISRIQLTQDAVEALAEAMKKQPALWEVKP